MSATSISTTGVPAIGASVHDVLGSARSMGRRRTSNAGLRSRRMRMVITAVLVVFAVATTVLWIGVRSSSIVAAEARAAGEVQVFQADGSDGARVMSRSRPALIEHLVVPGDTIWALAVSVGGDSDPRAYVDRVQRLNGLPTASLQVGQVVLLPTSR